MAEFGDSGGISYARDEWDAMNDYMPDYDGPDWTDVDMPTDPDADGEDGEDD